MTGDKRIKITYEDLEDPKVDDIIERGYLAKKKMKIHIGQRIWIVHRRWLFLLLAALIGILIMWGAYKVTMYFFSPEERTTKIGNSV
jgi:hypothetical protein